MILIAARHLQEAKQVAFRADLQRQEWRYIMRASDLRGWHGVEIWRTQCWRDEGVLREMTLTLPDGTTKACMVTEHPMLDRMATLSAIGAATICTVPCT